MQSNGRKIVVNMYLKSHCFQMFFSRVHSLAETCRLLFPSNLTVAALDPHSCPSSSYKLADLQNSVICGSTRVRNIVSVVLKQWKRINLPDLKPPCHILWGVHYHIYTCPWFEIRTSVFSVYILNTPTQSHIDLSMLPYYISWCRKSFLQSFHIPKCMGLPNCALDLRSSL